MTTSRDTVISGSKAAARLREAAVEVFAESGYGGTTTRQIAARLDMSPAAMYPHYKSKEELLYAISYEGHDLALQVVKDADIPRRGSHPSSHHNHPAFRRVAGGEPQPRPRRAVRTQRSHPGALPRHHGPAAAHHPGVRDVVDAGLASGEFTVPDAEGVTLALMSLCVDICRWYPSGRYQDPDTIGTLYGDLALRLVGAVH